MKRMLSLTLSVVLCCIFCTGCWDRIELNNIGIAYAVAVNRGKKNKISCTVQIVKPDVLKKKSTKLPVQYFSAQGETIEEAIRNIEINLDRKIIFSQSKVIVIDEQIAKEGLWRLLDFFKRNYKARNTTWILIAKNHNTEETIEISSGLSSIQGVYIDTMLELNENDLNGTSVNLMEYYRKLLSAGINPITGAIEVIRQSEVSGVDDYENDNLVLELSGTAVFKKDKLAGYLNKSETRGLNWLLGNKGTGFFKNSSIDKSKKVVNFILRKLKTKIKPNIKNGVVVFDIFVNATSDITSISDNIDISDTKVIAELEKMQQKRIEKEINGALVKLQKVLRSDVVGFGGILSKKYPEFWKKYERDWEKIFPDVMCSVNVKARINKSGLIYKPYEIKE
ncbi:Ger(x)C family spore germination protein [Clostridium oryzae]|uniref:Spore germination protein B3 n=1 Tax=Clostridium oryzae TaxID=1450648 RepID=A0A1V4IIB9_9CLOT|nr:Ger(x)C family spore germination protein [Clostridium oryzae]OPJ59659.1 spore germination protein B3 precursor [Clostridium oryzae]